MAATLKIWTNASLTIIKEKLVTPEEMSFILKTSNLIGAMLVRGG